MNLTGKQRQLLLRLQEEPGRWFKSSELQAMGLTISRDVEPLEHAHLLARRRVMQDTNWGLTSAGRAVEV
jgi:hypothetical protein